MYKELLDNILNLKVLITAMGLAEANIPALHSEVRSINGGEVIFNICIKTDLFSPRHTTPEKFFIEACDEGADAVLAIDRVSNEMTLTGRRSMHRNLWIILLHKLSLAEYTHIHV